MSLIVFLVIFVLGPIPLVHILLHCFLRFWKKHPLGIYLVGFLVWVFFLSLAWAAVQISFRLFVPPDWLIAISAIIGLLAFVLVVWAVAALGLRRFFLWAVVHPTTERQERIQFGPYRFLSHPAYFSYIFTSLMVFMATGRLVLAVFVVYVVLLMFLVIRWEDQELAERLKTPSCPPDKTEVKGRKIFGVKIDNFSEAEILALIKNFLDGFQPRLITTPNPEMLVEAEHDWFFKQALNQADLAVADGFGLVLAARYLFGKKLNRLAGADLMEKICQLAAQQGQSVYLVGGGEGVAQEAGEALKKKYAGLKIVGAEKGITIKSQIPNPKSQINPKFQNSNYQNPEYSILNTKYLIGYDFDKEANQLLLERICAASPDILFIAFGHGKQEKWLAEFLPQLPSVKVAMGVGGAFDYLAGRVRRAPKLLRRAGLEWLWRLMRQPWRLQRIWRALITFPFLVRDYKRQLALPYRQGVIAFIVNQEGKFFIAKRPASPSDSYFHGIEHWQPPQGAIEGGETSEEAIVREVKEETGLSAEIIFRCQEKCEYDWSIEFMRKRGLGYHFRGQQKMIFLLQYKGDGSDIKIDHQELDDYKWVDLAELKQIIHPFRRKSLEILLREGSGVIARSASLCHCEEGEARRSNPLQFQ